MSEVKRCSAEQGHEAHKTPGKKNKSPRLGEHRFQNRPYLMTPKRVVAAVAMSSTRGPSLGPGMAKHIALVPKIACLPPTGATISGEPAMTKAM